MTTYSDSEAVLNAFHHAAATLPFYADLLKKRGIDPSAITSPESFAAQVPVITKEDIFPKYPVTALCQHGDASGIVSAIVSSGTSGVFSYGLLTEHDVANQRAMFDGFMRTVFNADACPPTIINALPMGVSFVSSFPVVPTSVRTDIALEVIRTLKDTAGQIIIVTDPHVLKKLLEEGREKGIVWGSFRMSCIIGGTWFSDSYVAYMEALLNEGAEGGALNNHIFGTMGVTEIGLNLFGATPDLALIRHIVQGNPTLLEQFGGAGVHACPEIMYLMSNAIHVEVVNEDAFGVGDIVISHLDTSQKTLLIRYRTGDRGKFLRAEDIGEHTGISPALPFPLIALYGRVSDVHTGLTPADVKEYLYRNHEHAAQITGHFYMEARDGKVTVSVQLRPNVETVEPCDIPGADVTYVSYHKFPNNVGLDYEYKWNHTK